MKMLFKITQTLHLVNIYCKCMYHRQTEQHKVCCCYLVNFPLDGEEASNYIIYNIYIYFRFVKIEICTLRFK